MARRRMFATELVESDRFMDLPAHVQMLYIYMSIHADDEGFIAGARRMARMYGGEEGLDALEEKDFIIRFPSGVLVIVDWHLNNTIRKDRSQPTIHSKERKCLQIIDGRYVLCEQEPGVEAAACPDDNQMTTKCQPFDNHLTTRWQPSDNQMTTKWQPSDNQMPTTCQPFDNHLATQNRIEENRIEKNTVEKNIVDEIPPEYSTPDDTWEAPSGEGNGNDLSMNQGPDFMEIFHYCNEAGLKNINVLDFWKHYLLKGWRDKQGRPVKDWKALAQSWDQSGNSP